MRKNAMFGLLGSLLLAASAFAGGGEDAMAEAMNCNICKPMAVHMEELGPSMKHEMIRLNDGVAMYHWVTDESKVALLRQVSEQMDQAGDASAEYTPEQVKESLCSYCQGIHGLMTAGAQMSKGQSSNGSLMVISSDDPAVQEKIGAFYTKATEMMGG